MVKVFGAEDLVHSITSQELWFVRLSLQGHFEAYVSRLEVRKLLLHEENRAVVTILNVIVSASRLIMSELRKLHYMLRAWGSG